MSPPRPVPLFHTFMPADIDLGPVLFSGYLAAGAEVARFEQALAGYLGGGPTIATNSSSSAMTLALALAGIGPGSRVAVSPLACTATTMPILTIGAQPVWCDIDPDTGMIDPDDAASRLDGVGAILAYHWAGDVAAIERLDALARSRGIALIEDASEAFGAELGGQRLGVGTADFSVFSFHASKPVTTGEGGALICRDPADHARALRLRRFGIDSPTFRRPDGDLNPDSDIPVAGWNAYLTNVPAAIGLATLAHADRMLAQARDNAAFYDRALAGVSGVRPLRRRPDARSAFWAYCLRAERPDALLARLVGAGIGCQRLHLRNDPYGCFGGVAADLPGVAAFERATLCLPCGWWVEEADRQRIVALIAEGW